MLELPSDGSPNPRSQTSPGSTLPFGSAEYCDFRHRCTRLEIEESMHRTVELECFMYLLWSGLFGSLSSSPLRSGRWRGSFAPCGSQTAGCRSRGSKVFLAERHRSDIQHLVLCRSSQRCSERRTQPIIVHFALRFRTLLPRRPAALLARLVPLPAKLRFLVRSAAQWVSHPS